MRDSSRQIGEQVEGCEQAEVLSRTNPSIKVSASLARRRLRVEPGEAALDAPALGQHDKALAVSERLTMANGSRSWRASCVVAERAAAFALGWLRPHDLALPGSPRCNNINDSRPVDRAES